MKWSSGSSSHGSTGTVRSPSLPGRASKASPAAGSHSTSSRSRALDAVRADQPRRRRHVAELQRRDGAVGGGVEPGRLLLAQQVGVRLGQRDQQRAVLLARDRAVEQALRHLAGERLQHEPAAAVVAGRADVAEPAPLDAVEPFGRRVRSGSAPGTVSAGRRRAARPRRRSAPTTRRCPSRSGGAGCRARPRRGGGRRGTRARRSGPVRRRRAGRRSGVRGRAPSQTRLEAAKLSG